MTRMFNYSLDQAVLKGLLVFGLTIAGAFLHAETSPELGSDTYCSETSCAAGEGDCDSDSECQAGLVCVHDVGANYGFRSIVDVCEAPSTVTGLGSNTYCSETSCAAGEGDCDNDSECQAGLVCVHDVGANYGFRSIVDVCETPSSVSGLGSNTYCSETACAAGEGDCDNDSECQAGLVCVHDVGANYGFRSIVDVCESPSSVSGLGSNTYCSETACAAGEGDCDNDSECQAGLVCVHDVGANYGFRSIVDVCEASSTVSGLGSNTYCSEISCAAGEGDCDSDSECQAGLVCVHDVGANYGFRSIVDVCEASSTVSGLGSNTYCSEISCAAGEGDCDSDSECQAGLVCVHDVGANYGFRSIVDVCETPPSSPLVSSRPSVLDYVDHPPPIVSLITIGAPGPDGVTLVTGALGSVPPLVYVMVATVEYGDAVTVSSAADGGFSASVIAAPGATIQVRYNPYSSALNGDPPPPLANWPGTLMRVAHSPDGGGGTPFSGAGTIGWPGRTAVDENVFWAVAGTVVQSTLDAGEPVALSGTLRVYIPAGVTAPSTLTFRAHLGIDPMFDAGGGQVAAGSDFISRLLTPTGLPIERTKGHGFSDIHEFELSLQDQGGALVASFDTTLSLPPSLPPGTHRLFLWISGGREGSLDPELERLRFQPSSRSDRLLGAGGATVALFSVGTPGAPRLSPMLLVDSPNQGVRGTIATEERGRYEFAARVVTQLDGFVVEPRDRATGQLIPYRLEPFFPFLSFGDRFLPDAPLVPLDLPGGSLKVTVHTPSGAIDELGTHPILQTRTGHPAARRGGDLNNGGGNPSDVLQLTTLSADFVYRFAEYGLYKVTVSGSVPDVRGREYPFAGTFEVWVAETLDIEAASLPSTPFEVGDRLPAVVSVYPGVPADVEMSFELHPIDGSAVVTDSVAGTANRFGYFDGAGKAFELTAAGEYLVSLRASYTDAEGRLWMGARRWGSGVASPSPVLIAHGRRGEDTQPFSERRAWFTRLSIGLGPENGHINFPYHSGDIIWATNDDSVQMRVTVQDLEGRIAGLLEERAHQSFFEEQPGTEDRRVIGALPLILSTRNGVDAMFAPDAIDQWGYAYRAVQRPGVRVRETVGTDGGKSPYWRFEDQYLAQRGMGADGDNTNDIKWMFGAAVFKRPDLGIGEVAIYSSLWVQIPDEDPVGSRVFPPFQGAAGGPSGGPIMTLKGQEIDLFLMPTAVRPGTILEVGYRFVFAGQVGPPLASKVTVRVTSPGGQVRAISGQANSIGYFSDPAGDFVVDEPGVWTVDVEVLHDGMTSAGPVEPPYPTGGRPGLGRRALPGIRRAQGRGPDRLRTARLQPVRTAVRWTPARCASLLPAHPGRLERRPWCVHHQHARIHPGGGDVGAGGGSAGGRLRPCLAPRGLPEHRPEGQRRVCTGNRG